MYSAWASSVPPASVGGAAGPIRIYASADRIPSDFYVRDWNAESKLRRWFAAVHELRLLGHQRRVEPEHEHAGDAGSGWLGRGRSAEPHWIQFRLCAISRRAPAASTAPPATVTAHFFIADFGLGAAFVPIGSVTVTFAAGEMTKATPAHSWTVPVGASSHLCLAVQIEGPDGDSFALPSLAGAAPGPAGPSITADNNKAQRNLRARSAPRRERS